ncbi:MAG: DUF2062 domain-containing protein [Planctomycetes bacterium]|nr:DUF2062 domain-containing protein [Planctomycetota bacterium]
MVTRRARITLRRIGRKILHEDDPAPRIARGVAAGFFAAAFPLPGFQIALSVLCAAIVKGNKAISIFPQFLVNAVTMLPLAFAEFRIGEFLWPARAAKAEATMEALKEVVEAWTWASPFESTGAFFAALGRMGVDAVGPLLIGVLVVGTAAAALAYPLTIIGVWTWRARKHAQRIARGLPPRKRRPLSLPEIAREVSELAEHKAFIAAYTLHPEQFINAESAKLLIDGRGAFPEMLAAIDAAKETVDLESYIFAADATGQRFANALMRAAARGVRVRLIYDAIGSLGMPQDFIDGMLAAGVEIAVYHPLVFYRPWWAINRRDHKKILIVDRTGSFTGGLNIADEYASRENGGKGWRDTHMRIEGQRPAAALGGLFAYSWERSLRLTGGAPKRRSIREFVSGLLRASDRPLPEPAGALSKGGVWLQVIGNREFTERRKIRATYLHAIRNAKHYILIENAFFLPDRGIRRALAHAVSRGVKVAVAVSKVSEPKIGAVAGRVLYSELLETGIRIYEWPEPMLHAKTAVIDDAWAVVGSYNINQRSLFHDLEDVVVIADTSFARSLRDQTLADLARCHEVTQEEHESRPWPQMLAESAAYMMRYWL